MLLVKPFLPQAEVENTGGPHDEQHTSYLFVEPLVVDLQSEEQTLRETEIALVMVLEQPQLTRKPGVV